MPETSTDGDARCCQWRAVGTHYVDQYEPGPTARHPNYTTDGGLKSAAIKWVIATRFVGFAE